MSKIAFLGCSRGLGNAVLKKWDKNADVLLVSRKIELLQNLAREFNKAQIRQCDLADEQSAVELTETLIQSQVDRVFYFAGGGPFGFFEQKKWKDNSWALHVNFLTPFYILHSMLKHNSLRQFIYVGSKIAENNPEPMGTSYAAAKKAMRGVIESIKERPQQLKAHIDIFSPGYMDTDMLPPNAEPRLSGLAIDPNVIADEFITFAKQR
jgi:short-subunit dehydrogenase